MNWRESILTLALLLIALFLWQLLQDEEPDTQTQSGSEANLPGYYLNDAELIRYNDNGKPIYTITAAKIEQDPVSDELQLKDIEIEYHEESNWLITADNAFLPASRDSIDFSGNVIALKQGDSDNIEFSSESLNYSIKEQLLSTEDNIKAVKASQIITAKGMLLDMQNERVQLLSKVKIRFLP